MNAKTNGTSNEVRLIARLGADVELRYTPNGNPVATLIAYTSRSWTTSEGAQRQEVERHKIVVWGKQAEACNEHLRKGSRVEVAGSIHYPSWEDRETGEKRYGVEIRASRVLFLDRPQPAEMPEAALPEELGQSNGEAEPESPAEPVTGTPRKRRSRKA